MKAVDDVRAYLATWRLFIDGYQRFREITFKEGWHAEQRRWWWLYTVDYGSHTFAAGAVVSWSRWAWENRKTNRLAAFLNRFLNHLDPGHGENAGWALWDSKPSASWLRVVMTLVLMVLLGLACAGFRLLWTLVA